MDLPLSPSLKRRRLRRRWLLAGGLIVLVTSIALGVARLAPALPGVDRASVHVGTVERGPMVRDVRGSGSLVPEQIRVVQAESEGRVERLLVSPGTAVLPDTLLLVLGAAWLWRQRSPGLAAALLFLWLLNGLAVAWHGAWWDVFLYPRYLTTGWVALLVLVGAGLEQVRSWVAPRGGKPFVILACLALPAVLLFRNFRSCDRSDFTLAEDYARALLAELPPDSQFYSMADAALFPVWYL